MLKVQKHINLGYDQRIFIWCPSCGCKNMQIGDYEATKKKYCAACKWPIPDFSLIQSSRLNRIEYYENGAELVRGNTNV